MVALIDPVPPGSWAAGPGRPAPSGIATPPARRPGEGIDNARTGTTLTTRWKLECGNANRMTTPGTAKPVRVKRVGGLRRAIPGVGDEPRSGGQRPRSREFGLDGRQSPRGPSWGCIVPKIRSWRWRPCVFAALLSVSFLGGCKSQLAVQDSYFRYPPATTAELGAQTTETLRYNRALFAARRTCLQAKPGNEVPSGPTLQAARGRTALADLCAELRPGAPRAGGGIQNAYRRWLSDEVRPLPESATTAASAAGGS